MKRGWKIFFIVIVILILIGVVGGYCVYRFYPIYTARVCVSNTEGKNFWLPCLSKERCFELITTRSVDTKKILEEAPDILKDKLLEIYREAIYCDGTCKIKAIYGEGVGGIKKIKDCGGGKMITWEMTGKEALEVWRFLKEVGEG